MAEKKTESKSEDQGGGTAPALHLTPAVPNVALATKAQRSIPGTHPDPEAVGADAANPPGARPGRGRRRGGGEQRGRARGAGAAGEAGDRVNAPLPEDVPV